MQKTEIEIINETVDYYSTHPRAVSERGECEYMTYDGKKCAFGRCMIDIEVEERTKFLGTVAVLLNVRYADIYPDPLDIYDTMVNEPLKKEYWGHSVKFWSDIQHLHDSSHLWGSDGKLNEQGVRHYNRLIKRYEGSTNSNVTY